MTNNSPSPIGWERAGVRVVPTSETAGFCLTKDGRSHKTPDPFHDQPPSRGAHDLSFRGRVRFLFVQATAGKSNAGVELPHVDGADRVSRRCAGGSRK